MRLSKWLALMLALCMLSSMLPTAVSEGIEIELDGMDNLEGNGLEADVDLTLDGFDLPADGLSLDLPSLDLDLPALENQEIEAGDASSVDGEYDNNGWPAANARNYTELSNSTAYTMNGVSIRAGDEGTKGTHNCWKWAQAIYKKVWGCNFDSTFVGTASKGHNLLRNLTDSERKLTPEHLKYFVSHAVPGATLRVQSCPSSCSGFNTDGCGKHEKHSLIIAEIREDGMVTMDDQGSVHTRYYTWQGFCDSWAKKWVYVKYIKWPNAPALTSAEAIDGYSVSKISETYRVRSAATKGSPVYTLPENGKLKTTLKYPASFSADARALKTIEGYAWVHGKSSTGVTGWMPLTDAVAGASDSIAVTGVALDQSMLILAKGGSATLRAVVSPVDATNQNVNWSSSNSAVATVSGGVIKANGAGTATITATTEDGGRTASCEVNVSNAEYSKDLTRTGSNGTVSLPVGKKLQLIPTFATSRGWKLKSVSSSKSKYASVNKYGIVTAKKAGTTTITVKCKNGKKATLKVKVVKATEGVSGEGEPEEGDSAVRPKKVYLSRSGTVKMKWGSTLQLYAKVAPENAVTTLTWKSEDPKIAYVNEDGLVFAVKKGRTRIGVKTANGKYATVTIIVEE